MAAKTTISELVVKLGGDPTGALSSLDKVGARVQKFGASVSSAGRSLSRNLTAPLVGMGVAAFGAAVRIGNAADKLLDLEQQTGLTTDQLQEFRRVAVVAGVDQDIVADAAERLTRRLKAAGEESKGAQATLARLGISARDSGGNIRSMQEILPEIITGFQGMEDVTTRNSLAIELFGRGAGNLAPVLGLTADQFANARSEAHSLGLVLSREALVAANEFRIKWDSVKEALGVTASRLGLTVIPVFEAFVTFLQDRLVPTGERIVEWLGSLDRGTVKTALGIAGVAAAIGPLLVVGGGLVTMLGLILTPAGLVVAGLVAMATTAAVVVKNWDVLKLQGALAWAALKEAVFDAVGGILGMLERLPLVGSKITELRERFDAFAEESLANSGRRIAELESQVATAGFAFEATTGQVEGLGAAVDDVGESVEATGRKIERAAEVTRDWIGEIDIVVPKVRAFTTGTQGATAAQEGLNAALEKGKDAASKASGVLSGLGQLGSLFKFAIPGLGALSGGLGVFQTFAGLFQHGGNIRAGEWGVVREAGPEVVSGPASVSQVGHAGGPVNLSVTLVVAGTGQVVGRLQEEIEYGRGLDRVLTLPAVAVAG
jgi:hypothetical protein